MVAKQNIGLLSILFVAVLVFYGFVYPLGHVSYQVESHLQQIPLNFDNWSGEDRPFQDYVYQALNADDNFNRKYESPDGRYLWLYIGYYGTEKGGHPHHTPTGCYPGGGWGIQSIEEIPISVSHDKTIKVNNLYATKADKSEQTLYWLQNYRGTVMEDGLSQNIEKMKTKLKDKRADGAFIRVSSPLHGTREETIEYQKEFIQDLWPYLIKNWPEEVEA